jgi:hypothetical protein
MLLPSAERRSPFIISALPVSEADGVVYQLNSRHKKTLPFSLRDRKVKRENKDRSVFPVNWEY